MTGSWKEHLMTAMGEVYFDLDGTLTDPNIGITRSIRYALAKLDCAAPAEDELTWCIGPPLRASFRTMLGSDALADRALTFYRERFGDIGIYENTVYPGVVAILETLQASGRRLFVATSRPVAYASRIVEHFNMTPISNACLVPGWMAPARTRPNSSSTPSRLRTWASNTPP
jgi:phosphoglycolate phosphatase